MKKHFFVLVTLIVIISSLTSFNVNADASQVWDGSVASSFSSGRGTENDPYIIWTASQLAYFAKSVNSGNDYSEKFIRLNADIVLMQ